MKLNEAAKAILNPKHVKKSHQLPIDEKMLFTNDLSAEAKSIISDWEYVDAHDAEGIFKALSEWYTKKNDDLLNIDCDKMAKLLMQCSDVMNQRTGN